MHFSVFSAACFAFLVVVFFHQGVATPFPKAASDLPPAPAGVPSAPDIVAHASSSSPGGGCCAALSYVLGEKVSYPLGVSYVESLATYWSAQESSVTPKCVVAPTSTKDVSSAVFVLSVLSKITSFKSECKFAIKSGGHTPWAGAANQGTGVTIDLARLNAVEVSSSKTRTGIGAGNRWGNVYAKLDPLGLAVPGGRISTVGVGGLITGGGISYFSPRFGFVADGVLNFEVVLAFGKIVNANETSYPDLYRSLKGGSNNFGVVTRFDMQTFEQGPFWGGEVFYPAETRQQHLAALEQLNGAIPYDQHAAFIHNYIYRPEAGWVIVNLYQYTKQPAEPFPRVFQPFTNIQPQVASNLRVAPLGNFTDASELQRNGLRQSFATLTVGNSASLLSEILDIGETIVQPIGQTPGLVLAPITIQPMPSAVTAPGFGQNSLGFGRDEQPLFNVLIGFTWLHAADDAKFESAARAFVQKSQDAARKRGLLHPFVYLNYAAPWQDPIASYGAAEKKRLQQVSQKYDPARIFQKAVPGGFKLFGGNE